MLSGGDPQAPPPRYQPLPRLGFRSQHQEKDVISSVFSCTLLLRISLIGVASRFKPHPHDCMKGSSAENVQTRISAQCWSWLGRDRGAAVQSPTSSSARDKKSSAPDAVAMGTLRLSKSTRVNALSLQRCGFYTADSFTIQPRVQKYWDAA